MVKRYDECLLFKKFIIVKDPLPLVSLRILPLASNMLVLSSLPLSKAVRKVLFNKRSVMTALMASIDSWGLPVGDILTLGKSQKKLHGARPGGKGG